MIHHPRGSSIYYRADYIFKIDKMKLRLRLHDLEHVTATRLGIMRL